ncbi:MAG: ABC transporter permease subunit, partial [Anaerolineae bacterium]
VLSVAIDLYDKLDPLKYLTPFKYYNAADLQPPAGHLQAVYLLISGALVILLVTATYRLYQRKDLMV